MDWCLPSVSQAGTAVAEIAQIYVNGDQEQSIPKHSLPVLGDRAKYASKGKVMKRMQNEDVRLPFLL